MGQPSFHRIASVLETALAGRSTFFFFFLRSPGNVALMSALAWKCLHQVHVSKRQQASLVINLNHFSRILPVNGYKLLESAREETIPG